MSIRLEELEHKHCVTFEWTKMNLESRALVQQHHGNHESDEIIVPAKTGTHSLRLHPVDQMMFATHFGASHHIVFIEQ